MNKLKIDKAPHFRDSRGVLIPIEITKNYDFETKRAFVIKDVPVTHFRGDHAHKECLQLYFVARGLIQVAVFEDNHKECDQVFLLHSGEICFVDKMIWTKETFLEPDTMLMVFCSIPFDEKDYITEFETFLKLKNESNLRNHSV